MRGMLVLFAGAGLAIAGVAFAPTEAPPDSAGDTQPGRSLVSAISEFAEEATGGGSEAAPVGAAAAAPRPSASRETTQTYWQYIEDGKVKFVADREDVPEQWRARAGRVQMNGPPPGSPAEAKAAREARTKHIRTPRVARAMRPGARGPGKSLEQNPNRWPEVTIYTTKSCGYCRKAIAHLERKGVPFTDKDVGEDSRAEKEYLRKGNGRRGVPLIDVGGAILRGYSPASLDKALAAGAS